MKHTITDKDFESYLKHVMGEDVNYTKPIIVNKLKPGAFFAHICGQEPRESDFTFIQRVASDVWLVGLAAKDIFNSSITKQFFS